VDAVVHLAAKMQGPDEAIIRTALEGTRRLVDAMEQAAVRHLVLASSLSVYDWGAVERVLDEDSPLEPRPEERDAYTTAKVRQEQLARERCARSGIALTVLRPGLLWGAGREDPPTIGPRLGVLQVLIGPARQLPVVHVENCADAFAAAADAGPRAAGTFNVIDHPDVTVRRFVRDRLRRTGRFGLSLPAAYRPSLAAASALYRLTPAPLRRRLPSFVAPPRFAARYRPVLIDGARFRNAIGWRPPLGYDRCLDRTYGGPSAR
jgi:UDP-glucose 4-epimerase